MSRESRKGTATMRMVMRAAVMLAILSAPLMAVQHVQAGSSTIIESSHKHSNGAGFVLLMNLRRS